jgi:hypothetical protein
VYTQYYIICSINMYIYLHNIYIYILIIKHIKSVLSQQEHWCGEYINY